VALTGILTKGGVGRRSVRVGPAVKRGKGDHSSSLGRGLGRGGPKVKRGMGVVWHEGALGYLLYDGKEGRRPVEGDQWRIAKNIMHCASQINSRDDFTKTS
jgi:hypothetical protein